MAHSTNRPSHSPKRPTPPPPQPPFRIQPASPTHALAISTLGSQVFTSTFGHSLSSEDLATYLQESYSVTQITQDLSDPLKQVFVASDPGQTLQSSRNDDEERIMGFAQLTIGTSEDCVAGLERPVELQRLYVYEQDQGKGVGRGLMQHVEAVARGMGFRTMWLGVWEENLVAQRVYAKRGFVEIGEHEFHTGECVQVDRILWKGLGGEGGDLS